MTLEEKYRRAIETLQAISTRAEVARKCGHWDELAESAAMRDMDYAAAKCLHILGEYTVLPSYLKKRKGKEE